MKIGIVGAGLIGRSWAIVFARAGHEVRIWDKDSRVASEVCGLIATQLGVLHKHDLLVDQEATSARIQVFPEIETALDGAVYVQENLPEKLEIKTEIFQLLDELCPRQTVLASSTSSIPASLFSVALSNRERCVVAHPVNPPHLIPLVEVCGAPWTSEQVVRQTVNLMDNIKQRPVLLKKEIEGFVLNRLQGAVLNEAFKLVKHGYMSVGDVDATIKDGLGLRWAFMGPFETIDLNAPEGLADYCRRYGGLYESIAAQQSVVEPWTESLIDDVAAHREQMLPRDQLRERADWRDTKLMELVSFKNKANLGK
ncbi:MAG: 3-hydroxyacyl-CoA dehydrogenase [Paralcaligenes sp.]